MIQEPRFIQDTNYVFLNLGDYSYVFLDNNTKIVRKVFRTNGSTPKTEEHCRAVFDSEVEAFAQARLNPAVAALVPIFHGTCDSGVILDGNGCSMSEHILSDCAYEMSFEAGCFTKIGTVNTDEYHRVSELFRGVGIRHVRDASVCLGDGKIIKVIDFATTEFEVWV